VNQKIARSLVALEALWILLSRDYAGMWSVPDVFWRAPVAAGRWRYLLSPSLASVDRVLEVVAALLLVAIVAGIAPRACSFVAAILLYHLAPLETAIWSLGPEARGMTLAPTCLLVCAADLDDGWSLRLVQLLVVEIYLFSAIGKLERSGLSWGSAEHMRLWLLWFNQDSQMAVFTRLGPWIATKLWLCGVIGAATVIMEWSMPLMLFWKRSRLLLVPIALVFHIGVLLTMNIHVPEAWLVLVFVDWESLQARVRGHRYEPS
jgi:hypothetical protein